MSDNHFTEQLDITHHQITAEVKWFNAVKGFGFVQPSDGSPDAFMHISVVERAGHQQMPQGCVIVCDLSSGQKGLQVAAIHSVESVPEEPPPPVDSDAYQIDGTVKFYSGAKGFGFVVPDDSSKDVFVSARLLERVGIQKIEPDQRVRMMVHTSEKGPTADSVEII